MDRHFSGLNSRMNLIYQSIGSGGAEWLPFSQPPEAIDAVASQPNHEFKKLVQLQRQNDKTTNDKTTNDKTTNDKTTNDNTTNDERQNDKTTNDKTTKRQNDKTTNDKTTNDKTTNDKPTNDKTTNDERLVVGAVVYRLT